MQQKDDALLNAAVVFYIFQAPIIRWISSCQYKSMGKHVLDVTALPKNR